MTESQILCIKILDIITYYVMGKQISCRLINAMPWDKSTQGDKKSAKDHQDLHD